MRASRLLPFAVAALAVSSVSAAAAASLTTSTDRFGSGSAAVQPCGAGTTTAYTVVVTTVTKVTFTNVPSACGGGKLTATLTKNGAVTAAPATATIPAGGGTVEITLVPPVSVADVTDTRVLITGL